MYRFATLLCCAALVSCVGPGEANLSQADRTVRAGAQERVEFDWPPRLGERYPDLELWDHEGRSFRLSTFEGKVLLIEPIGMTCPACNAFAGGQVHGGFRGVRPQSGLDAIAEYLPRYGGGVTVNHPDLVVLQLLLYNMEMRAPTVHDAASWRDHFDLDARNHHVVYGGERMINQASYDMIPGFQLVDRNFILISDAAGHQPPHNLWHELLPLAGSLLRNR